MTTTEPRTGRRPLDTHTPRAGAAHLPLVGHVSTDAQWPSADEAQIPEPTTDGSMPKVEASVRAQTSPATTNGRTTPTSSSSPGISNSAIDQSSNVTQSRAVDGGPLSPAPTTAPTTPTLWAPVLVDHHLAILANRVNDLENFRKASANQLGALTQGIEPDKDGEVRGYGLPADHPAVVQSQAIVDAIQKIEDQTVRKLEKKLKKTPLGPWVLSQKGLGYKTIARLLATTGDPYWNALHDRPRTVSELWAFCGYRPGQRKQRGQQVNWSTEAKTRAFNCIDPVLKTLRKPCYTVKGEKGEYLHAVHDAECKCSPYRLVYDLGREKYAGSLHHEDCVRCGPKGKPALAGSPRSAAHQQQMAIRLASKALLRDLWREAKRLHELPGDQVRSEAQWLSVAGVSNSSAGQSLGDTHFYSAGGGPT